MASEGSDYTILYIIFSFFSGKSPRPKSDPVYPSFFTASAAPQKQNIPILFGVEKLECFGYPKVKKVWWYVYPFQQNTGVWQTDGRTSCDAQHRTVKIPRIFSDFPWPCLEIFPIDLLINDNYFYEIFSRHFSDSTFFLAPFSFIRVWISISTILLICLFVVSLLIFIQLKYIKHKSYKIVTKQ